MTSDQPISPYMDELLGPSTLDIPPDKPISPHLDELLGPLKNDEPIAPQSDEGFEKDSTK